MHDPNSRRWEVWFQWASIMLVLVGAALHGEQRLSRLEQAYVDAEQQRAEITAHLDRIEQRIDNVARAVR